MWYDSVSYDSILNSMNDSALVDKCVSAVINRNRNLVDAIYLLRYASILDCSNSNDKIRARTVALNLALNDVASASEWNRRINISTLRYQHCTGQAARTSVDDKDLFFAYCFYAVFGDTACLTMPEFAQKCKRLILAGNLSSRKDALITMAAYVLWCSDGDCPLPVSEDIDDIYIKGDCYSKNKITATVWEHLEEQLERSGVDTDGLSDIEKLTVMVWLYLNKESDEEY